MKSFDDLGRELLRGESAEKLKAAASSDAAARLMSSIDQKSVEQAARSGDAEALKKILAQVLSTPDGKALAKMLGKKP